MKRLGYISTTFDENQTRIVIKNFETPRSRKDSTPQIVGGESPVTHGSTADDSRVYHKLLTGLPPVTHGSISTPSKQEGYAPPKNIKNKRESDARAREIEISDPDGVPAEQALDEYLAEADRLKFPHSRGRHAFAALAVKRWSDPLERAAALIAVTKVLGEAARWWDAKKGGSRDDAFWFLHNWDSKVNFPKIDADLADAKMIGEEDIVRLPDGFVMIKPK